MAALARQGYDLIIGVGFAQGDAIADDGEEVPGHELRDRRRRPGDPEGQAGERRRPPLPEQQVGYIVGYLAALRPSVPAATRSAPSAASRSRLSTATSPATRRAPTQPFPARRSTWGYSQDWDDQAKCKELALNQIAAGSKVVFQVAGGCGLGALSAAKDQNVWGIGVDADQSFLGPHVLTSALKGVDASVFLTVKAVLDGTWKGGRNADFGLDQDGVGLGKVSPKASKADVARRSQSRRRSQTARSPAFRRR